MKPTKTQEEIKQIIEETANELSPELMGIKIKVAQLLMEVGQKDKKEMEMAVYGLMSYVLPDLMLTMALNKDDKKNEKQMIEFCKEMIKTSIKIKKDIIKNAPSKNEMIKMIEEAKKNAKEDTSYIG
jgi:EamA domain-containing membrane protein RarD